MKHMQDRLPEYLMDDVDRKSRAEIESHLQECAVCREEYDVLLRLWAKLGTLEEQKPSERVCSRFYAMLEAYQEGLRQVPAPEGVLSAIDRVLDRFWPKQPALQAGLALLLLVVGLVGGTRLNGLDEQQAELAQLQGEVRHLGQLLTVSLLSQQSASERLRGVTWTHQMERPDDQVLAALVKALKHDPNVNVRLAAIDALGKYVSDPSVQDEVLETLPRESSPLVQIALIDLLIEERITRSAEILREMARNPSLDRHVLDRIKAGINELSL